MTGPEKLGRGRVWILETLFQVAEEHDCLVGDFRFIPTNEGERLLFHLNGDVVSWILPLAEIEDCALEGTTKEHGLSGRAKIRQRLRELPILHNGNSRSEQDNLV